MFLWNKNQIPQFVLGAFEVLLIEDSDVLLWIPQYGRNSAGRPHKTYIKQLCEDVECLLEDLPGAMEDRDTWRERVMAIPAISTPG